METLVELLNALKATIDGLQLQLIDAQNALNIEVKNAYDKGFADGVASMGGEGDAIYTQAELDAAVAGAVAPLNEQIAALNLQMVALQESIQPKIDEALVLFKASLLAQYEAQQVVESDSETGFKNLLA